MSDDRAVGGNVEQLPERVRIHVGEVEEVSLGFTPVRALS